MLARWLLRGFPGAPSALPPAPDDSAWTRAVAYNPMLSGDPGQWNQGSIDNPSISYVPGRSPAWNGWYAGAGTVDGTFMGAMDSADGDTWTWHLTGGLDVPVLGGYHGGVTGQVYQPNVDYFDGTYFYAYYHDASTNKLNVARSTDGYTLSVAASDILAFPAGVDQWATASVCKIGAAWYMLVEGHTAGPAYWQTFTAKSTTGPTSGWTIMNGGNPLSSLQVAAGGMFGGPNVRLLRGGIVHTHYHAAPVSGSLPTDLYTATIDWASFIAGSDAWTKRPGAILTHSGSGAEASQLADPALVWDGSQWRMYFSAVSSQSPFTAVLEMATTGPA